MFSVSLDVLLFFASFFVEIRSVWNFVAHFCLLEALISDVDVNVRIAIMQQGKTRERGIIIKYFLCVILEAIALALQSSGD